LAVSPLNSATTNNRRKSLVEYRYPFNEQERPAETAVLAKANAHFAGFAGSQREAYDALVSQTPVAAGVSLEAVQQDGVQGWWVRAGNGANDRAILFVHGGAYMLGSGTAYRGLASQIVARTGVDAFVLDYPLAPEHPFPAAYEATLAARHWLGTQGIEQLALVGDSAGGGLILASLAAPNAAGPTVRAALAFSPWTDLAMTGTSFTNPTTYDPVFRPEILSGAAARYLGGADPRDGRASPLYGIPDGLPPIAVQVGADELLLDDARRYAKAAAATGSAVTLEIYEGLHHVFQRSVDSLPSAAAALDSAADFLGQWWIEAKPTLAT
jgi:acetyl esterase/lipase